jgi:membrane protein DedA with SNARE-associated domain
MLGFIVGVLVALDYFNPFAALAVLILADVIPDITYYFIGRFGKSKNLLQKWGPPIGITPERADLVRNMWFNHTFKTMMITKFAFGLSTPLLITAGLVHLPFNRFWRYSVPLSFLQYSALLTLGYFFGGSFAKVEDGFLRVQIIVAAVAVLFVVYYLVTSRIKKQFLKEQKQEQKLNG